MIEVSFVSVDVAAYALVEEVGYDFRYIAPGSDKSEPGQSCYNWHENEEGVKVPGCIVGTILNRLGVPLEAMSKFDGIGNLSSILKYNEVANINEDAVKLLRMMQILQDKGATWYSAYRGALTIISMI